MTLSRFASTDLFQPRTLTEQHLLLEEIVETFDATEVPSPRAAVGYPRGEEMTARAGDDTGASPHLSPASPAHEQSELFAA